MRAAARLAGLGTSIFAEMSRLAVEHGAINLGQGFPDFEAPGFVKDAAVRAVLAGHNQYAPSMGVRRLRQAIADTWARRGAFVPDTDAEITVTAGATEALLASVLALVDPGDEVIVFEPFYDAYVPDVTFAGGVARAVRLSPPRWDFDPATFAAAITPRTKLVILNTPHNPTGKMWTEAELDALAALCRKHDLLVIADEVYSEITFDGHRHVSIATRPGMRERTITIDSIGKTFSVTGWKIGWAIAPPPLTTAIRGVHQFVTFCNSTPLQEASADALEQAAKNGYYDQLRRDYTARRALLARVLDEAGLPTLEAAGSYFLLADIGHLPFADDAAFCRHLVTGVGVAAIPPSAFYVDRATAPKLARFCFAKKDETMLAAAQRLAALVGRSSETA